MPPRAPRVSSGKKSAGSRRLKNGALDVRDASAFSNAVMGCSDAPTRDRTACSAGLGSASSRTTSSPSVVTWPLQIPADPPTTLNQPLPTHGSRLIQPIYSFRHTPFNSIQPNRGNLPASTCVHAGAAFNQKRILRRKVTRRFEPDRGRPLIAFRHQRLAVGSFQPCSLV